MSFELGVYSFGNTPRTAGGQQSTAQAIRDVLEAVHLADEVGLDFFGFGEHHTRSMPLSSPTALVSAAAASTRKIRLGTTVTVLSTDDPVRVFQQLATSWDLSARLDQVEQLFYTPLMVRIGIRELNQRTSQVLDRVRRGETVIVTDHGEPVARLVPIGATASVLDELIDAGKAIPPHLKGSLPPAVAFGDPAIDSTEIVDSLRDEV